MKIDCVIMNPYSKLNYSSFYVYGLRRLYGRKAKFGFRYFSSFPLNQRCFEFVIFSNGNPIKYAVDFHDDRLCESYTLEWSEYYAKINLHQFTIDDVRVKFKDSPQVQESKIFSIPPSFGIRVLPLAETFIFSLRILLHKRNGQVEVIKNILRSYIKRKPLRLYKRGKSFDNYIFFIGSIWHKTTAYINLERANFIRACKTTEGLRFEGGFVDIGYEKDYIESIDNLMYRDKKIPLKEFIEKTQNSTVVFNNPSVAHCHGWKLAEYLAMGKAIISLRWKIKCLYHSKMNMY